MGLSISALFLYLAIRQVDFDKMLTSFRGVNYWILILAVLAQFISHWIRAVRWRILLKSIKLVPVSSLFSATMIGYMGNTVLPAHLGEIFRANVIGNRENISTSSILATLAIERILDVLAILVILVFAMIVYPFPQTVTIGGYIMFGFVVGLFVFLILLKNQDDRTLTLLRFFLKVLPKVAAQKIEDFLISFIDGINGLERKRDYIFIFLHSILIWFGYLLTLHFVFYAFDLFNIYNLSAVSSLVLLVTTTFSIVVPAGPGYVGTYHITCQRTLNLFGVPLPVGLSFAVVAHIVSLLPAALLGFVFAWREGISRLKTQNE